MAFSLPSGIFDIYYEVCDELIDSVFIGENCKIFYPPKRVICVHCNNQLASTRSSNFFKHGGPGPRMACHTCNDNGYTEQQVTETIRMRVYWHPKDWVTIQASIKAPAGSVQVVGYIRDMPKIIRADEIQVLTDVEAYRQYRFKLHGEPTPHGFGHDRYFLAVLSRT